VSADAGVERRLAGAGVVTVQFRQRTLDRERRPHRALGIVLLCDRIAEQHHEPVTELFGDMAAHPRHRRRGGIEIGADEIAPFLGVKLCGNAGRINEIAEHHREIAALAFGSGRSSGNGWLCRGGRDRRRHDGRRLRCRNCCPRCAVQRGDRAQEFAAVAQRRNADLFQVLISEIGQDREIDIILGETRRVFAKAETVKPLFDSLHCTSLPGRCAASLKNTDAG